ncbi:MlaC/ttg2D family ABC transporter substrate-binding protein [Lentisalinibacter salinarum]|uniref:MlaC/ttg2D family ABC transporter substrate-binding protein n=1 Tax=Lentisalinibacter salinarum TaxID=2992239 RepID=UPI003866C328
MRFWMTTLALLGVLLSLPGIARAEGPTAVIETAVDELSEALEGRKLELSENRQELYEVIDGILLPRFDRRYASQLVLGRYWRTASEEQQERFIRAFYQALVERYADGVLEFDEERIEVLPFRGDPEERRTTVRTEVKLDDGTEVPVNYGLVKREDGWKVYDVTVEGISYVRNFRTELNAEIASKGLEGVIQRLEREAGLREGEGGESDSGDAEDSGEK